MQNQIKAQFTIFLLSILFCFGTKAQKKEETAIVNMLKSHEAAFAKQDTQKLKADWLHDESVEFISTSKLYHFQLKGWPKVDSLITANAKIGIDPALSAGNYKVTRLDQNLAFAEYDQRSRSLITDTIYTVHRHLVLVKKNKLWKIASIINTLAETYAFNSLTAELSVNTAGYDMLGIKEFTKAIELFKLNVKYFPNSWNAYDSLGEAYAENGDKLLAIENYEKSVAMNPKNLAGIKALERLRK